MGTKKCQVKTTKYPPILRMRKAFLLVCALFISLALLFIPSTEARALLQKGVPRTVAGCGQQRGGRYTPCIPRTHLPKCSVYVRGPCTPAVSPRGP
ncbi:hypothetical protein NL676_014699 [Syzygium grande]|nr:hypothetical protein NL676_014699 [Syzygium grande]